MLATISVFKPMSIFSMVVSGFQFLNSWNLFYSTVPLAWLTDGRLILEVNLAVMGTAGYWGPQVICTK